MPHVFCVAGSDPPESVGASRRKPSGDTSPRLYATGSDLVLAGDVCKREGYPVTQLIGGAECTGEAGRPCPTPSSQTYYQ